MEKGLVSIISPCYNREHLLFRLLDSILAQTYKQIQLILVDDGSTDRTRDVALSYKEKFIEAGILFEYYYQENAGVSAAINEGLKYVKGEFLCWPDSDDWYEPESIRKRVKFLNTHPDIAIVSSDASAILADGETVYRSSVAGGDTVKFHPKQFQLLLEGRSLICCICHMIRTEAFFSTHPNGQIYNSRHGQNIQMLLPVYYSYKRGFIDEVLCHYLVAANSLSRSDDTFEKKLSYRDAIETLTVETLKSIDMPAREREKYIRFANIKNTKRRLLLAKEFRKKDFAQIQINKLKTLKALSLWDIIAFIQI